MAFSIGKKQKKAVKLFFNGYKVHAVATIIGVHRTTLWRWWQHPEMIEYTAWYFITQNRRILKKFFDCNPFSGLDSDNPWEVTRTAVRVLDLCADWIIND